MLPFHPSIRQKITLGYYAIVAIIIGISVFTFLELRYVERKIAFGEIISEFLNTTLEIRRFEKNYFLYGKVSDYQETLRYVESAGELLGSNSRAFTTIATPQQISLVRENLPKYRKLLEEYSGLEEEGSRKVLIEGKIRKTGKDITTTAEEISKTERRHLQVILNDSQSVLILSILTLSFLAIVIGQVLSRMVVRPLKQLEQSMEQISSGTFEIIHIHSKDREVISLTKAFNKMLRELDLRQRHLVQTEKLASLGTLLSGVAHELNNPLSNISTSCQILAEEIEENDMEYKKELLRQIEEQTDRARNIVRSLLEFSRDKDFRKEALPLRKTIEETIRFVKGQIPTGVEIRVDISPDIVFYADKQRIQQAFLNLIRNAVEAIPGEGSVFISAQKHRAVDKAEEGEPEIYNYLNYHGKCTLEEDTVDIGIRDTGVGIPRDLLQKIFDPFFTTKDVGKGSGLGLSIVHEIIEEHDGCIAVDSMQGQGTVFLIRLPLPKEMRTMEQREKEETEE
ncbi:MAG: HAMP domain-containing histidine kinase [Alphaproteobacteria bacterium]|uniref:histidine kinase n=1 Tax=Candidatus Nitrobium versatile TaxID=2884831 RepID=A0A953JD83_9BACT|nr:HAMP domain-containing histidine kinase [Candidatus Nitrobium versatile]